VQEILWVGLGGFAGAVLRYVTNGVVQRWTSNSRLPHGTMAVNIIGCLVIGLLSHLVDTRSILNTQLRLLILIGFLGAFTTFSTFSNETLGLFQQANGGIALLNVGAHLLLGLVAVWGGQGLARLIWG
jgi:CrcB protein